MHRFRTGGFTLVELMVTIAIVAILLAIGFPSFQSAIRSNRLATTTNELIAGLSLARTQAIASTHPTEVCPSTNGTSCSTDWNAGWIVWLDENANGSRDDTEPVVRYIRSQPTINFALTTTGSASTNKIRFDNRGRPDNGTAERVITLTPSDCPAGQQLLRTITLKNVGQISVTQGSCPT